MVDKFFVRVLLCCQLVFGAGAGQDRRPSLPYVSGDGFRFFSDFIWDETGKFDPTLVKKPSVIFVKTDLLGDFFTNGHPYLQAKYVLISHNSDLGAPGEFTRYLDSSKLIHWFGQNPTVRVHPKFTAIPIGIMNRYLGDYADVRVLSNLQKESKVLRKNYFIYVNFNMGTNVRIRKIAYDFFAPNGQTYLSPLKKWSEYLRDLAQSEIVVCPPGNGLDCHRTWEALLMGAVPLTVDTNLTPLFEGLPVLVVSDWRICTNDFLRKELAKIRGKAWNLEKLYMDFWVKKIRTTLAS